MDGTYLAECMRILCGVTSNCIGLEKHQQGRVAKEKYSSEAPIFAKPHGKKVGDHSEFIGSKPVQLWCCNAYAPKVP